MICEVVGDGRVPSTFEIIAVGFGIAGAIVMTIKKPKAAAGK